jgi:hypothetical protein
MNVLNRLLLILLSLVALIGSVAVLLVTLGLAEPAMLAPSPWFRNQMETFTDLESMTWNWTVGITSAVTLISLLLLVLELRPGPRKPSRLVVRRDGLGQVTMRRDSIRDLVNWEVAQISGVMEVQSHMVEDPDGLRIHCRVSLDPQANASEVAKALQERIKAAIEQHVGRHVSQVTVDTQLAPLTERRSGRRVR